MQPLQNTSVFRSNPNLNLIYVRTCFQSNPCIQSNPIQSNPIQTSIQSTWYQLCINPIHTQIHSANTPHANRSFELSKSPYPLPLELFEILSGCFLRADSGTQNCLRQAVGTQLSVRLRKLMPRHGQSLLPHHRHRRLCSQTLRTWLSIWSCSQHRRLCLQHRQQPRRLLRVWR